MCASKLTYWDSTFCILSSSYCIRFTTHRIRLSITVFDSLPTAFDSLPTAFDSVPSAFAWAVATFDSLPSAFDSSVLFYTNHMNVLTFLKDLLQHAPFDELLPALPRRHLPLQSWGQKHQDSIRCLRNITQIPHTAPYRKHHIHDFRRFTHWYKPVLLSELLFNIFWPIRLAQWFTNRFLLIIRPWID